tara:strand:+ start:65932 stop:66384 length:453 start_codon:yes stop_codon:yes gene_type:complete
MKTRIKRTRSHVFISLLLVSALGAISPIGGCKMIKKHWNPIDMNAQLEHAPPIRAQILNNQHMLMMQAPNPGWAFTIDKDEQLKDQVRLYITIRRPDPAFAYPQVIVEKSLLTDIHDRHTMEVYARVLDANEKSDNRGYQPLRTVEQFDE